MSCLPRKYEAPGKDLPFLSRFVHAESGALTIFGLLVFVMMMISAGVALDLMRAESERARLQYTIDRAVLSAASTRQDRDPETVVHDYIRAAGFDTDDITVVVNTSGTMKEVSVSGKAQVDSLFMDVLGHDTLFNPTSATAREASSSLEVSLVLDVSDSMARDGNARMKAMKLGASNFISTIVSGNPADVSVSIVPYNGVVDLGAELGSYLPLSAEHTLSSCVTFSTMDYFTTGIATGSVLSRLSHFDEDSYENDLDDNDPGAVRRPTCPTNGKGSVIAWSNKVTEMQTFINNLETDPDTSIDLGVKVGVLLLDPSIRPYQTDMVDDGKIAEVFRGRPYDYGAPGTQKVLVVMTDGRNWYRQDIDSSMKAGPANVFAYRAGLERPTEPVTPNWMEWDIDLDGDGAARMDETFLSFYSATHDAYWVPHLQAYHMTPFGGDDAIELTYPEVFSALSIDYLTKVLLQNADGALRNKFDNAVVNTEDRDSGDDNLSAICAAARNAGIKVYTIALQAPDFGEDAMRDCAGPGLDSNYYDLEGLDMSVAFDGIIGSLSRLRLTQ